MQSSADSPQMGDLAAVIVVDSDPRLARLIGDIVVEAAAAEAQVLAGISALARVVDASPRARLLLVETEEYLPETIEAVLDVRQVRPELIVVAMSFGGVGESTAFAGHEILMKPFEIETLQEVLLRYLPPRPGGRVPTHRCRNSLAWTGGPLNRSVTLTHSHAVNQMSREGPTLQKPAALDAKHILIVEDHLPTRQLLGECAIDEGWVPHLASGRDEAIQAATTQPLSLVVLDLCIPSPEEGMELAADLQRLQHNVPILAISASLEERRALEIGAYQFLAKPFELVDLLTAIHEGLELAPS
jgi:DNA-binding NtrC family response regulator